MEIVTALAFGGPVLFWGLFHTRAGAVPRRMVNGPADPTGE